MTDLFSSARALHKRGHDHIGEFAFKHTEYLATRPYRILVDDQTIQGEKIIWAKFHDPIPTELACVVFDAINCLRSALDHAVFCSAAILTDSPDPKSTKFPFGDSYTEAESEFKRGGSGVPASIRDFLLDFKPYKGGNETLWGFNKIRNLKIHRILAPTGGNIETLAMGRFGPVAPGLRLQWEFALVDKWNPATNELEIGRVKNETDKVDLSFSVKVAFAQSSPLPKADVLRTLNEISSITLGIIDGIEAETAAILKRRTP